MPLLGSYQPLATTEITLQLPAATLPPKAPQIATTSKACCGPGGGGGGGGNLPAGPPPDSNGAPEGAPPEQHSDATQPASYTVIQSTVYATAPYTSTVIVTKKTPVVIVQTPTASPPPVFSDPDPEPNEDDPAPPNAPSSNNPGGSNPPSGGSNPPSNGGNPPAGGPSNNNPPPAAPPSNPAPGPAIVVPGPSPTSAPLGGVIVSLIRTQPFVPPATPSPQATIGNVPVIVLPSSVILGSSAIPLPVPAAPGAPAETVATINGQPFTIRPSEVVVAGSTVAFPPVAAVTPAPATRVPIAPGITAFVADSTAVIQGTTYRIGFGATPTTITAGGVPVILGPYGVVVDGSTAVAVPQMTEAPMVVESAGGLIFSIDESQVIVDGTTFRIGQGAPTITTEIDGQSVSIGPHGVGLQSTTLKPTSVHTSQHSGTSTGEAGAATDGLDSDGAATSLRLGVWDPVSWMLMVVVGLLV
jgi:hypothetical protein